MLQEINWATDDGRLEDAELKIGKNEYTSDLNQIAAYLNRPLSLQTDPQGKVRIEYQIDRYADLPFERVLYDAAQLPNGLHVLGAIHTFYNQPLTDTLLTKWFDVQSIPDVLEDLEGISNPTVRDLVGLTVFEGLVESHDDPGVYEVLLAS